MMFVDDIVVLATRVKKPELSVETNKVDSAVCESDISDPIGGTITRCGTSSIHGILVNLE